MLSEFSRVKLLRSRGSGMGIEARKSQKSASQGVLANPEFIQTVELTIPRFGRNRA
jgi:hypothetical protein